MSCLRNGAGFSAVLSTTAASAAAAVSSCRKTSGVDSAGASASCASAAAFVSVFSVIAASPAFSASTCADSFENAATSASEAFVSAASSAAAFVCFLISSGSEAGPDGVWAASVECRLFLHRLPHLFGRQAQFRHLCCQCIHGACHETDQAHCRCGKSAPHGVHHIHQIKTSHFNLDSFVSSQRLCISQILQCVYKCYNLLLLYYKNVKCQAGEPEIGLWERSEVRQVESLFGRKQESG